MSLLNLPDLLYILVLQHFFLSTLVFSETGSKSLTEDEFEARVSNTSITRAEGAKLRFWLCFFLLLMSRYYAHASRETSLSPRYKTCLNSKMADTKQKFLSMAGLKTKRSLNICVEKCSGRL